MRLTPLLAMLAVSLFPPSATATTRLPPAQANWRGCVDAGGAGRGGTLRVDAAQQCTLEIGGVPPGAALRHAEVRYVAEWRPALGPARTTSLPGVDLWDPGARPDSHQLQVRPSPTLRLVVPMYLRPESGRTYTALTVRGTLIFTEGRRYAFTARVPVQARH